MHWCQTIVGVNAKVVTFIINDLSDLSRIRIIIQLLLPGDLQANAEDAGTRPLLCTHNPSTGETVVDQRMLDCLTLTRMSSCQLSSVSSLSILAVQGGIHLLLLVLS